LRNKKAVYTGDWTWLSLQINSDVYNNQRQCNYLLLKSLHLARKCGRSRNVDFSPHSALIRIRVMSQCIGIMLKGVTSSYLERLFIGLTSEILRQAYLGVSWYEFCITYEQAASETL
jgi:hypothetical protein